MEEATELPSSLTVLESATKRLRASVAPAGAVMTPAPVTAHNALFSSSKRTRLSSLTRRAAGRWPLAAHAPAAVENEKTKLPTIGFWAGDLACRGRNCVPRSCSGQREFGWNRGPHRRDSRSVGGGTPADGGSPPRWQPEFVGYTVVDVILRTPRALAAKQTKCNVIPQCSRQAGILASTVHGVVARFWRGDRGGPVTG